MIVDALGNPLALSLTGGQVHDITQAEALAAEVQPEALLGDKGYDADGFIESLEVRAIKPVIPPKSNRKVTRDCDFALYAERNLIERFFQFIKQFRGIATRYEKTARNFLAGLHLVCALAWLKWLYDFARLSPSFADARFSGASLSDKLITIAF